MNPHARDEKMIPINVPYDSGSNFCIESFNFNEYPLLTIKTQFIQLLTEIVFDLNYPIANNEMHSVKIKIYQQNSLLTTINNISPNIMNKKILITVDLSNYFQSVEYNELNGIPIAVMPLLVQIELVVKQFDYNSVTSLPDLTTSKYYLKGLILKEKYHKLFYTINNSTNGVYYNVYEQIFGKHLINKFTNTITYNCCFYGINSIMLKIINYEKIVLIEFYFDNNCYCSVPPYLIGFAGKYEFNFNNFYAKRFNVFIIKFNLVGDYSDDVGIESIITWFNLYCMNGCVSNM